MLTVGVVGTSLKENEHRVPIHPGHFNSIPPHCAGHLHFETDYGRPFGVSNAAIESAFGGVAPRERLLAESDVVLLPKPLPEDLEQVREGGILWGWPHCVQQFPITQVAIERKLTLIAWEAMNHPDGKGHWHRHLFYRNNEMAGYAGVLHALALTGNDGLYGPPQKAVVLSHGSVSQGAIHALRGRQINDIDVFTRRPPEAVDHQIEGCRYGQFFVGEDGRVTVVDARGRRRPLVQVLAEATLIVNGILQDTDAPVMYLQPGEEDRLRTGAVIVDASCDEAMGFPFARPTSFEDPVFPAGPAIYYAVDHTPSYLWRAASWEVSTVVLDFLETVMGGPGAWKADPIIRNAIEITDGVIQNEKILSFQNRAAGYPHPVTE